MADMLGPKWMQPREMGDMVGAQANHRTLKPMGIRKPIPLAWPVVTIAREFGDQDPSLGRHVARRLRFSYWDRGIVMELFHNLQGDHNASFRFDERLRYAIEALLGTNAAKSDMVLADYADEICVIRSLIIRRGGVVVDGRGAQLLVDPCHALRVRMATPFDFRARRIATRDHISLQAAQRLILDEDRERSEFVLRATGHSDADPATFDVVANTETYPGESALGLVLMAYFAKFGDGPLAAPMVTGVRLPGPRFGLPSIQPNAWTTAGGL